MKRRLLLAVLALVGCGGSRPGPTPGSAPPAEQPLASFASVRLIVMPTQSVRSGDPLGWSVRAGGRSFLAQVDSAIEVGARDRNLVSAWTLPSDLARTARRNPLYAVNPSDIRAGDAVRVLERKREENIPEPVASQLRTLAGFHDARYALIPAEVRFEPGSAAGTGQAILRVAVLDIRGSKLAFIGDVVGPVASDFSPAMAGALVQRFLSLVVP